MEQSLISRVKSLNTRSATAGNTYVKLWVECIEHMFSPAHDWSVLAYLLAGAQPADGRILRAMTGKVLQGWSLKKDDKQPTGMRFVKKAGENQGYDEQVLETIRAYALVGKVLQSKDLKEYLKVEKPEVSKTDEQVALHIIKYIEKMNVASGEVIALVQKMLVAQALTAK